jgi:two-component system LytT family response regulator
MLRAVIIDDIDQIRSKNIDLIREHCPQVAIMAEAVDVKSGIEVIRKFLPDLVFLDVEMPDGTGFDLLQQLKPINFKVIFITGFQDFAIRAFRFSAIDYLLKPIDPEDLVAAVAKAEDAISKENLELKLGALFSNIEPKSQQKMVLKTAEKLFSVNIQDIVHCESERNYTTFHFVNAPKLIVSTTLKEYETMLVPMGFFRPHQSHLINMAYFDHFVKADGGLIVMKNDARIPLASRKREEFMALMNGI